MRYVWTVIITLLASTAYAQNTGTPIQITPYQILDARTGQVVPCVGCKVYTYSAGTVTPLATYTDSTLTVPNTNPVVTDSSGYASNGSAITGIWVGTSCYKLQLQDANSVVIWTQDHLCPAGAVSSLALNGLDVQDNTLNTNGGYINFKPVTYNPYDGSPCFDYGNNPVNQPLPTSTLPGFGPNDLVLWNSLSPLMPANGSCGVPLPVNLDYGLNTNGYFFARGGLATDQPSYNSIQSLFGGFTGNSFTAGTLYPTGTATLSGPLPAPAYLGGHIDIGHSVGTPATGTIATTNNPYSQFEGLVQGQMYFDDALDCFNGYFGTVGAKTGWHCIDSSGGGGGGAAGITGQVQFNTSNVLDASGNFTWENTNAVLQVNRVGPNSGIISPVYNANVAGLSGTTKTFQNSDGTYTVTYNGFIAAQLATIQGVITSNTGFAGPVFNSTATGSTNALQQQSGTFAITGAGNAAFQSLALTNGMTAGSGAYGLTGAGVLTVSSCVGCTVGGAAAGTNQNIQYNASGAFTGSNNLNYDYTNAAVNLVRINTNSGYIGPLFNANVAGAVGGTKTFQNSDGSYSVDYQGNLAAQTSSLTGISIADHFVSNATGVNAAIRQVSNNFIIAGNGGAVFSTITTPGSINVAGDVNVNGSWSFNHFGDILAHTVATTGVVNGNSFQTNSGSYSVSAGGNIGGQGLGIGSHGLSSATGGAGADISNSMNNISMFLYDTGGVCGIGTGEPGGIACSSDERLKRNIQPIDSSLHKVLNLKPKTFEWKSNGTPMVGFLAQDVQGIIPSLVKEKDGLLMLSQEGMIPYLVKSIQELQVEIDSLKTRLVVDPFVRTLVNF